MANLFRTRQKLTAAHLNEATGMAWTTYTSTWLGSTNPSLGNGTKTSAWTKIGKTVLVRINLLMGSTTTYGTGSWSFTLPEACASVPGFGTLPIFPTMAMALDAGTAYKTPGIVAVISGGSNLQIIDQPAGDFYKNTVPHTWAVNDYLAIFATYEGQ